MKSPPMGVLGLVKGSDEKSYNKHLHMVNYDFVNGKQKWPFTNDNDDDDDKNNITQRAHAVEMTSYWCRSDVITSHRRPYDVMCLLDNIH